MYTNRPTTYIVELTEEQVRLMGQLLHLHLFQGEDKTAAGLVEVLVQQTNCVSRQPELMHVYNSSFEIPEGITVEATRVKYFKRL